MLRQFCAALVALAAFCAPASAAPAVHFGVADIGHGIALHYAEEGAGPPAIFIHGSISDMTYWKPQVDAFAKHYRAIAYSRRYDFPNSNPARPGYSAVTDAEDLAGFIRALHLGPVYLVGHSYGALTALILATRHPELIRAMVLAEPPAISLLDAVKGPDAARAHALHADIDAHMVAPMRRDFTRGDASAGVGDFIDYVFADPHAWAKFSKDDRAQTMRDVREWQVMMTTGTLFPGVSPEAVARIRVPTLIMSGGKSYPFLALIDAELARLIPHARTVTFPDAGHQMWYRHPGAARRDTEAFFARVAAR